MANRQILLLAGYVLLSAAVSFIRPSFIGLMFFGFFILKGWIDYGNLKETAEENQGNESEM